MIPGNAAPLLPFGEPAPRTLKDVHADLSAEMARLHTDHPDIYAQAAALFKERQNAKSEVDAAEGLLTDIRAMTAPANVPFPPGTEVPSLSSVAPKQDAGGDASTEEPASEEKEEETLEEDSGDQDLENPGSGLEEQPEEEPGDEMAPEDAAAPLAALPAGEVQPVTVRWPEGRIGTGLLSGLASTLTPGDTLSLVLCRVGDDLLVTVQPVPLKDEPASTAQSLQARGTPAALDTQMISKLTEYQEGRQIARETVNYVAGIKAAAEAHRKAAASAAKAGQAVKSAPAKTAAPGQLTLEVAPKEAVLVLQDVGGKTYPVQNGKATSLPAGEYTLSADAAGYESRQETFSVKAGKPTKAAVVLKKESTPGLF